MIEGGIHDLDKTTETKGPCAKASANAILTDIQIASRPPAAQIVGTISFASAQLYSDKQAFHEARDRHRIKAGSKFDWDGSVMGRLYGWRVGRVRALAEPRKHCQQLYSKLNYRHPQSPSELTTFDEYWKLDSGQG